MTASAASEPSSSDHAASDLADLIRRAVPAGATPTGWCHKPIHRHIVENAPDVVEATRAAISDSFADTPHVIIEIRAADVESSPESEIAQAVERTDGGVVVVGIGYSEADRPS